MRKTSIYFFCLILSISATQLKAQNCWSPLGSGVTRYNYITAMTTYNGNLIAAGQFDSIGGIGTYCIASWDGSSWSPLGSGVSGTFDPYTGTLLVSTLIVYNGELYAGGQFDSAGGQLVNNIAKWNGSSWSPLGTGILGSSYTVQALAVYNGALYAGGRFDTAGGITTHNIAKWNGTQWSDIDSGLAGAGVYCLTSFNGVLCVGGGFSKPSNTSIRNIAVWNDSIWSPLGSGIGGLSGQVTSLVSNQGTLYGAILYSTNHYPDSLVKWDGNSWSTIAGVTTINNNIGIDALFPFNNNLIIGGGFDSIGGVAANNIAMWNGTSFSEFGGGLSGGFEPQANIFYTFNGYLYAGGNFTLAGSDSANSIAEYTCATDGIHEVSTSYVHVYPNPTTGMINISIDNAEAGSSVKIYDLLGQKVFQSNISSDNTSINLSGHAAGSYLYHISGSVGESISAGMIIIQ
jgi:hypothetical protein